MRKIIDNRWEKWPIEASVSEEIYSEKAIGGGAPNSEVDRMIDSEAGKMIIDLCLKTAGVSEGDSSIKNFVGLYGKLHKMSGYGILNAHGCTIGKSWAYCDEGDDYFSVQDWINQNDGKYAALILSVCNEDANEIHSQKSLVISPNNIISGAAAQIGGLFQNEIYYPRKGYVGSYCIDSEMERLSLKIREEEKKTLEILVRKIREDMLRKRENK